MNGVESSASSRSVAPEPLRPPGLGELVHGFFMLGVTGFGGVMPLAHRMIVEERRWLSESEFTELLGLCQFLPGGNICNMSVAIGWRFAGVPGAIASLVSLMAAPIVIVIALGTLYAAYSSAPLVRHAFAGIAAAAAGLFVATAVKLGLPLRGKWWALGLVAVAFAAVAIVHVPMLVAVGTLVPVGYFLAGRAKP